MRYRIERDIGYGEWQDLTQYCVAKFTNERGMKAKAKAYTNATGYSCRVIEFKVLLNVKGERG